MRALVQRSERQGGESAQVLADRAKGRPQRPSDHKDLPIRVELDAHRFYDGD